MQRFKGLLLGCVIFAATVAWAILAEPGVRRAIGWSVCVAAALLVVVWAVKQARL